MSAAAAPSFADTVRAGDREHYLAALFAPAPVRMHLLALAAYRLELDRVVLTARDPMAAEIRLQWWRDAVRNEGYGEGAGLLLVQTLREGMAQYGWPAETLCAMSEARIHDLYADPFATWDAFDGYAGEVFGAPMQLAAMALCVSSHGENEGHALARTAAEAAGWGGVAIAAARDCHGMAHAWRTGRTHVPANVWLVEAGTPLAEALTEPPREADLARAVRALADHGTEAFANLMRVIPAIAPAARAALLPAMVTKQPLVAAARAPADPPVVPSWRMQLSLWRAARSLRAR